MSAIRTLRPVSGMWAGVRERVTALAGRSGVMFGADHHRFALAAPLTAAQLAEWEQRAGARLPEEFRGFLTEVGATGAGPYYGLLGLRLVDGRADWVGDHWRGPDQLDLRVAFPHVEAYLPEPWPEFGPLPPGTDPEYARARRERDEIARTLEQRDIADTYGAIPVSHQGCGYYDLLVVTGPDAGQVWTDNRACDGPIEPLVDGLGRVTFGRWYLGWLGRAEAALDR